jgi:hypothetical protein
VTANIRAALHHCHYGHAGKLPHRHTAALPPIADFAKGYGASEWREDLRRLLKRAGCEGREVVFLLSDTQIIQVGWEGTDGVLVCVVVGEGFAGQGWGRGLRTASCIHRM